MENLVSARTFNARQSQDVTKAKITSSELRLMLEWAGMKLFSLPYERIGPKKYRVAWPSFAHDAKVIYGFSTLKLKPAIPNPDEIDNLDAIFNLVCQIEDVKVRRIIQARSLIFPISKRHLYSWSKIGDLLSLDRKTVKAYFEKGLCEILRKTPNETLAKLQGKCHD